MKMLEQVIHIGDKIDELREALGLPVGTSFDEIIEEAMDVREKTLINIYEITGLEEYDNTSTYAVGDYVYHNDLIYKCKTAISVAEEWNSAHWTEITYTEYLKDLLNIPPTGVSESSEEDVEELFEEEGE